MLQRPSRLGSTVLPVICAPAHTFRLSGGLRGLAEGCFSAVTVPWSRPACSQPCRWWTMPASRPLAPSTARLTVGEAPRALRGCVVCPAPRGLSETLPRGPRDSSTPHIPEGRRTRCPVTGRVGTDWERPQPGGEDHPTRGASHRPVRFSSRAGRETAARASTAVTVPLRPRTSPERHSRGATPSPGRGGATTARLTVREASVVRCSGFDFRPSRGC